MYRLYCVLKDRGEPPTTEEIGFASGKKLLDSKIDAATENIQKAFAIQEANAAGPWDQAKFERLLTEWIIACDQPFDEVEKEEFIKLMTYARHPASSVKLPKREGIRRRVLKMGEDTIDGVREMFKNLEGKVALSLDAWTSSNQYAFLAIVAHYVTNEGQLEELLVDFRELVGEHSGENMAEAVWETMKQYGLIGRIIALVMDNATNNDTLALGLEQRSREAGVHFSAMDSRMRCMPHTVHLAAIKLLEGIGAISKADSKKAKSRSSNYQDNAVAPVDREFDDDAVQQEDEEEVDENTSSTTSRADGILSAVARVRKIIRSVRSSPQCRQSWFKEIYVTMNQGIAGDNTESAARLMLILDVRTRWSSTHQMLRMCI
ncbi:hypothetical protein M378DRAFT_188692 [Amanita muscaria Koide BX008]|uniref:Uncharacterized protein n=1 Tax=Amanita muscaria (strain Koide BX008) TaxID=946122 RepID=A0A0C2W1S2_AMAMK|nr:hypothetical protein M378DRAFT_188692 [Amanita muscaria Koide BX008]